jgi:hypothetical protein
MDIHSLGHCHFFGHITLANGSGGIVVPKPVGFIMVTICAVLFLCNLFPDAFLKLGLTVFAYSLCGNLPDAVNLAFNSLKDGAHFF